MAWLLGVATLEEFLDLFRVLWFVQPLVYLLMLAAVIRLWKAQRLPWGVILIVGLSLLIVAEFMGTAIERSWITIGYSPSYAAMMQEWEREVEWEWWEPVCWWGRFSLDWLGLAVAAVGFVMTARAMARRALKAQLAGCNRGTGGPDAR